MSEFIAPEADIVYLIPLDLINILNKYSYNVAKVLQKLKQDGKIEDYYIPEDIRKNPKAFDRITEDNRLFFKADIDYFEEDYLKLRKFGRASVKGRTLEVKTSEKVLECNVKPYLTVFNAGVGIYTLWLRKFRNISKRNIIDLCFIDRTNVITKSGKKQKIIDFIIEQTKNLFGNQVNISKDNLLENALVMIIIKDFPFESSKLPYSFIEQYKGHIFDILTLPERYYGKTYDYHKTRTKEYIDRVLCNISVRRDFPVFVSNNRFLGIKIKVDKPIKDYDFKKRIIFNIVLYSNVVLQLKLLKNINRYLSDIIKDPQNLSLGRLVSLRELIFRDIGMSQEYLNARIQKYEVWRKAMEDATKELGILEFYKAVQERVDTLNMYIQATYQKSSNILFIVLNTLAFISAVIDILAFFLFQKVSLLLPLTIVALLVLLWLIITYKYFARYLK